MTLRNKIFVFNFSIFLMGVILVSVFTLHLVNNKMLENYKESSEQEIDHIQNNLDILLQSIEDYLRILSTDEALQETMHLYVEKQEINNIDKQEIRRMLSETVSNLVFSNSKVEGAIIWDNHNQVLYKTSGIGEGILEAPLWEEYLNEIDKKKEQKAIWGDMILFPKYEEEIIVFPCSKKIIEKNSGKTMGKVTLFLREDKIEKVYKEHMGSMSIQYMILDNADNIVTCSDKQLLGEDIEKSEFISPTALKKLDEKYESIIEKNVIYVKKVYEKMNWTLISKGTFVEYNNMKMIIIKNTALIVLIVCTIVFFGAWVIARRVTKPIYSLMNTMKIIQSGDMKARTEHFEQKEIEILSEEFNKLMEKLEELMEKTYLYQKNKRIYELKLLLEQIKPHFLYNSLETVISLIKIDYKEKSLQMMEALSDFYRKSLSGGSEIIKIKDEIDITEKYLLIQGIRYENYMDYEIDVNPEILQCEIPKLTLQPLVENALYHGIKQSEKKADLIVRGYVRKKEIIIEVFDSGVGMKEDKLKRIQEKLAEKEVISSERFVHESFGLYNVNERIHLYYGENYGIMIESTEGEYTQVTVTLPKLSKEEVRNESINS